MPPAGVPLPAPPNTHDSATTSSAMYRSSRPGAAGHVLQEEGVEISIGAPRHFFPVGVGPVWAGQSIT